MKMKLSVNINKHSINFHFRLLALISQFLVFAVLIKGGNCVNYLLITLYDELLIATEN